MCEHYDRSCHLKCNTCNEFFACRLCHDVIKYEGEKDYRKAHQFQRKNVTEIRCNDCLTIQPPGQICITCNINLGKYFCSICNLFDHKGEEKGIWHCDGCNLCRAGGKDNFTHCESCNCCISKSITEHTCKPNVLHNNCPVCTYDLFTSRDSAYQLPCGHYLHSSCYKELISQPNIPRCPCCNKSCLDLSEYWEYLTNAIKEHPLPDELKKKVSIVCCDCNTESNTDFHVYGLKCLSCNSFNTKQI